MYLRTVIENIGLFVRAQTTMEKQRPEPLQYIFKFAKIYGPQSPRWITYTKNKTGGTAQLQRVKLELGQHLTESSLPELSHGIASSNQKTEKGISVNVFDGQLQGQMKNICERI